VKRQSAYLSIKAVLEEILDDSTVINWFGSGPLKTYLPESDIDITVIFTDYFLKNKKLDNGWNIGAIELTELKEELERHSEIYKIEEVIIINASVKLIKLYCDGIPIDISFNQIGGICTLNYLEAIDEYIGRDHLFK